MTCLELIAALRKAWRDNTATKEALHALYGATIKQLETRLAKAERVVEAARALAGDMYLHGGEVRSGIRDALADYDRDTE